MGQQIQANELGAAKDELDRTVEFEVRGKLSRLGAERGSDGKKTGQQEWKEMGMGTLQVLYGKPGGPQEGKRYLLMRDEKLGKIKLNTMVVPNMKFTSAGKANTRFFAQLMEPLTDEETGKVIDHEKLSPSNVMLNLKVPKDKAEDTLKALQDAVPK